MLFIVALNYKLNYLSILNLLNKSWLIHGIYAVLKYKSALGDIEELILVLLRMIMTYGCVFL